MFIRKLLSAVNLYHIRIPYSVAKIGRVGYKNDSAKKQTDKQRNARFAMLDCILNGQLEASYGLRVEAPKNLADDPSGDQLDALLCAIQAAWAWSMREHGYGAPLGVDSLEGWIADPSLLRTALLRKGPNAHEADGM